MKASPKIFFRHAQLLSHLRGMDGVLEGLEMYRQESFGIGEITELICEAADASVTDAPVEDGKSGDTDFPHGNIKPLATVGEISRCEDTVGEVIVGVPDGLGAYLVGKDTVRAIVQSESYGPIVYGESYSYSVNNGAATFTGSHIQYVDYDRSLLAEFMDRDRPAARMVEGFGEVIKTAFNLAGEPISPRNRGGLTSYGVHYSNTDASGNWSVVADTEEADWHMQSLCSAHLEQKHQWDSNIGLEDDIFVTNEEWMTYAPGSMFVGLSAHAVDLKNYAAYALGVFHQSGFEKIVEINPRHPDYVMFAIAGE